MRLDFSKLLYIDFEAQSELDIREVGAFVYTEHDSTTILCAAWCIGDGEIQLWKEGEPVPLEWYARPDDDRWFVAHNHDTERQILLKKFGIKIDWWLDTASLASCAGLPRSLWDVSQALHLDQQKHRQYVDDSVMLQLARPRKASKDNPAKFWRPETRPDLFEKLYDYCKNDVSVMREILKTLPPHHWMISSKERQLENLTNSMNETGVKVDLHGIGLAALEVETHGDAMTEEFKQITGGVNPKSNIKAAKALGLLAVDKESLRDALKLANLSGPKRRAIELKKTINTAAVTKLKAFANRTSRDGRLHGSMVYCGAGRTWRWSSMGVQLHNLIRGLGSGSVDWPAVDTHEDATQIAFDSLHNGVLSELYDNPTRTVASMMKGFLLGPFYIGDFSQIEPRVGAKLAGQVSMLDRFRLKQDPYIALASVIYGVAAERVSKDQRFMGKQGVLGCGYGLGRHGFINMLKTIYDIEVSEEEAQKVVTAYREMNPQIVSFWYDLERLVKQAVLEQWQEFHTSPRCPGLATRTYKSWLCIRLPSGRILWYFEPELVPGERGFELHYWGRNPKYGGKWMRVKTYGGKLAENVTQATARDIMAEAMLRLTEVGFEVLMTVHDEIVCAAGPNSIDLELFEHVMRQEPEWFKGIPLNVDVQYAERYQK
jgi:DNA polymerase